MRLVKLLVVVVLTAALLLPVAGIAQDSPSGGAKRAVKLRVNPPYPLLAQQMHVTGKVKLEVIVEPDGSVKTARPVGGSPLLVKAAMEAVKNWKYEPTSRESTEIVEFVFAASSS